MSKRISFNYKGKDYTLEFTRRSVKEMEARGFNASELETKPMTTLSLLFSGAFLAHHRYESQDTIDTIYDGFSNKKEMLAKLVEMYNDTLDPLADDQDEADGGNISWTMS